MPYEIALVNPRKVKKMAKRKKGKMPAGLKRYWAAKRAKKTSNPRKKKRASHKVVKHAAPKRRHNPRTVHHRRRRRSNPRFNVAGLTSQVMPALIGAGGAVAMDVALGYLPLPAMLQSGLPKQGVRVAAAVAVGWGASKVLGKAKGQAIMQGALTIIAYDLVKQLVHKFAPTVPGLAGDFEEVSLGYMNPAPLLQDEGGAFMGAYMEQGTGAYMEGDGVGDF